MIDVDREAADGVPYENRFQTSYARLFVIFLRWHYR